MNYTFKFMRDPGAGDGGMGSLFGDGDGSTPPVIVPPAPPAPPSPPGSGEPPVPPKQK